MIDRVNGVAYVDISERADEGIAREWADALGYKDLVTFRWALLLHLRIILSLHQTTPNRNKARNTISCHSLAWGTSQRWFACS